MSSKSIKSEKERQWRKRNEVNKEKKYNGKNNIKDISCHTKDEWAKFF